MRPKTQEVASRFLWDAPRAALLINTGLIANRQRIVYIRPPVHVIQKGCCYRHHFKRIYADFLQILACFSV